MGWREQGWASVATLTAAALVLGAAWAGSRGGDTGADAAAPGGRDLAAELRYIGRDGMTGMPASVDEGFIAAQEQEIERYGKDEREPLPPPAVEGVDVARVGIPALAVDAATGRYGVDRFGRLDVPQDRVTIGWNPAYSGVPGQGGATFFAAHYEYGGIAGVFFRLNTLTPGDRVNVTLSDGSVHSYGVVSVVDYPLGAIDMGAILEGREGMESITLMTCSGPPDEGEYPLRTVVLAERTD